MMSITVTDPTLLSQLREAGAIVELTDPSGRFLGMFAAEGFGKLSPGVVTPFTDQERTEMRNERTGRPLRDILGDLGARG